MLLERLRELASQEKLVNKYLVELFYDDIDFEELDTNLISGLRVLNAEMDEVVYKIDYKASTKTLHYSTPELMRGAYANN